MSKVIVDTLETTDGLHTIPVASIGTGSGSGVTLPSVNQTKLLYRGDNAWAAAIDGPFSVLGALDISDAVSSRDLRWSTAGSFRWIQRTDSTAESGGNHGSNWNLLARDDAGTQLFFVLTAQRSTGAVGINTPPHAITPGYKLDVNGTALFAGIDLAAPLTVDNGGTGGATATAWQTSLQFKSDAAGGTARTVREKLKDWVSVRDFGAVGDGSTDDRAAIQAAIDSLPSTGGTVFFPPGGWWRVGGTVNVNKASVRLLGQNNRGGTNIYATLHSFDMFAVTAAFVTFENMGFLTGGATGTQRWCINSTAAGLNVRHCQAVGIHSFLKMAATVVGYATVEDVSVSNFSAGGAGQGFYFDNVVFNLRNVVTDNSVQALNGVWVGNCGGGQIDGCDLQHSGNALELAGSGLGPAYSVQCTNTYFDNSTNGLVTGNCYRAVFVGCWFGGASNHGANLLGTTEGVIFDGCQFLGNLGNGLHIGASTVRGIMASGCTFSGHTDVTNGYAVRIAANATHVTLTGNRIGAYGAFAANRMGVDIAAGTGDHFVIADNWIAGQSGTNFADASTGTHKSIQGNLTDTSSSVASAGTMTLPPLAYIVSVTGTTNITSITASTPDRLVVLKFAGALTVTNGSNLKLASDYTAAAAHTLTLVCDGTNWYEVGRS